MSDSSDRSRMRPFGSLAPFSEARRVAGGLGSPVQREERLAVERSVGRVLARDAVAVIDVPTADRAAMDGYAVRAGDGLPAGTELLRAGRIAAGEQAGGGELTSGDCVEIATGAPLPPGADAVVPVEETERSGERVRLEAPVEAGRHVSARGEDLRQGRPITTSGSLMTPSLLAACVAGGVQQVTVVARPRVLVAPTGDEVVPAGAELEPGQVYDSNAAGLLALIRQAGGAPEHAGIVRDDREVLARLLEQDGFELIVTVGGTSVGRRDLVSDVVGRVGETRLHGVAVKPGKPLLLGAVGSTPIVGLPGFPTTCMSLGYALVDPIVRRLSRRPDPRPVREAPLAEDVDSPEGKTHLLPVAIREGGAVPTFRYSSAVSSMATAHGWIEIDAEVTGLEAGERVRVNLY